MFMAKKLLILACCILALARTGRAACEGLTCDPCSSYRNPDGTDFFTPQAVATCVTSSDGTESLQCSCESGAPPGYVPGGAGSRDATDASPSLSPPSSPSTATPSPDPGAINEDPEDPDALPGGLNPGGGITSPTQSFGVNSAVTGAVSTAVLGVAAAAVVFILAV